MIRRVDPVPSARSHELLREAVAPLVADMQHVRGLTWAKALGEEIQAVIGLRSLKGEQLGLVYGICCAWVPVAWARPSTYEWPHSLAQTTLHLWVDHWTVDAPDRSWISTQHGERALRLQAGRAAQRVTQQAPDWWARVSEAPGVLAEAQRQAVPSDVHAPPARLVAAFTLARLGDLAAAESQLVEAARPDDLPQLREMLRSVAQQV